MAFIEEEQPPIIKEREVIKSMLNLFLTSDRDSFSSLAYSSSHSILGTPSQGMNIKAIERLGEQKRKEVPHC